MTENEAYEILDEAKQLDDSLYQYNKNYLMALDLGIKALEEIQQYRTLGTVEEIRSKMEELARWHSDRLNSRIKNEFAAMSTLVCHNCDHKDEYIEELEYEIEEYRAIGTTEECRAAMEKQIAKKPLSRTHCKDGNHPLSQDIGRCPCCNGIVAEDILWCDDCGQKLDWSDSP